MSSEVRANKLSPATGTALQISDSGDTTTIPSGATLAIASGATVTNSGTASGFGLFSSYAILREEQTSGTAGQTASGSPSAGTWYTRVINVEAADPSSIVTISSNQFTLAAGDYLIYWWAAGAKCGSHQTRLYDVTGTAVCTNGYGSSEVDGEGDRSRHSVGHVRISPSSSNVYRVEHAITPSPTGAVMGKAASLGTEVYFECIIYKEA
jgi:hypothetical protein